MTTRSTQQALDPAPLLPWATRCAVGVGSPILFSHPHGHDGNAGRWSLTAARRCCRRELLIAKHRSADT
jgi:hypothetical protein